MNMNEILEIMKGPSPLVASSPFSRTVARILAEKVFYKEEIEPGKIVYTHYHHGRPSTDALILTEKEMMIEVLKDPDIVLR